MSIRAHINFRLLLFTTVFFCLFCYLGFWQLDRADEKKMQLAATKRLSDLPAAPLLTLSKEEWVTGRKVRLQGTIGSDQVFLRDNVVLAGQVGFEVLHPMVLQEGQTVLVNRGFVSGGASRDQMPAIPPLADEVNAFGQIYVSSWPNRNQILAYEGWPRIVPTQDPTVLSGVLAKPLLPLVIRLDEMDVNALPRDWRLTVMLPAKHTGYAVQWFAMAATLLGLFCYFTFRSKRSIAE